MNAVEVGMLLVVEAFILIFGYFFNRPFRDCKIWNEAVNEEYRRGCAHWEAWRDTHAKDSIPPPPFPPDIRVAK